MSKKNKKEDVIEEPMEAQQQEEIITEIQGK